MMGPKSGSGTVDAAVGLLHALQNPEALQDRLTKLAEAESSAQAAQEAAKKEQHALAEKQLIINEQEKKLELLQARIEDELKAELSKNEALNNKLANEIDRKETAILTARDDLHAREKELAEQKTKLYEQIERTKERSVEINTIKQALLKDRERVNQALSLLEQIKAI